jgi:hypothetical protein
MYSLLTLSALAANYFLLRLLQREKLGDWAAYSLTLTVTLLTHFLGVLDPDCPLHLFFLLLSVPLSSESGSFQALVYLCQRCRCTLSGLVSGHLSNSSFERAAIGWIAPASWYEPLLTLFSFSIGPGIDPANFLPYVAFSVYVIGLLAVGWFGSRNRQLPTAKWLSLRLLWMWLTVPLLLLTIVSIDLSIPNQRFIYMDRYIISLLPAFVLLAAWGLVALSCQSRAPRWLLPLLLAAVLLPHFLHLAKHLL